MKKLVVLLVSLLAVSAWAGPKASGVRGYMAANGIDPDSLASRSDIRLFVDSDGNVLSVDWDEASVGVPAPDLDALPGEEASVAAEAALAEAKDAAFQDAKPLEQKLLENAYFDAVETVYSLDGAAAPTKEEARDLKKVSSRVKSARGKLSGTGQGGKKTADDYLAIDDARSSILLIDAQLRDFDPQWRARAKRHVVKE